MHTGLPSLILVLQLHIFVIFILDILKLSAQGCAMQYAIVHAFYQSYRESFSDRHNPCCGCRRFLWRVLRRRLHRAGGAAATAAAGRGSRLGKPQRSPSPEPTRTDHPGAEDGTHRAERLRQEGAQAASEIQAPFPTSADAADMLVQQFKG